MAMYEVIFSEKSLKNLKAIPKREAGRVLEEIEELAKNPAEKSNVKKLHNHPLAVYRLRVGTYRVLFDREDRLRIIEIIDVGHRKEVYE